MKIMPENYFKQRYSIFQGSKASVLYEDSFKIEIQYKKYEPWLYSES